VVQQCYVKIKFTLVRIQSENLENKIFLNNFFFNKFIKKIQKRTQNMHPKLKNSQ
jgi:hypothetical protein